MGNQQPTAICIEPASNGDAVLADGTRVCGLPAGAPHPRRHVPVYAAVRYSLLR